MRRAILWLMGLALLGSMTVLWASTAITNTPVMTYTDAAGKATVVPGNMQTTQRLDPPIGAGVPASILPGQENTLTVTLEISPAYLTQTILLPTTGGAYVAGSLVITGTTGTITDTTPAGVSVSFPKPTAVKTVVCTYKIRWD